MTFSDYLTSIVLGIVAITLGISVPLLKRRNQKLLAILSGILSLLLITGALLWGAYLLGKSSIETAEKVIPVNVFEHFDFEKDVSKSFSAAVCEDIPGQNWFENCVEAHEEISLVPNGFNSKHSLGIETELTTKNGRVFSVKMPLDTPVLADAISVHIYNPDANKYSKFIIAAHMQGEDDWVIGEILVVEEGWHRLFLDIQQTQLQGQLPKDIGIDEIHIDIFANSSESDFDDQLVKIDDIEFYYPHTFLHIGE
jgi:hypothetical protein